VPALDALNALLKEVSRSFYLSLRAAPETARPALGLAYLLCRAADTIADLEVVPAPERVNALDAFRAAFEAFPANRNALSALAARLAELAAGDASAEGRLLKSMVAICDGFLALSKTDRALVQAVVLGVIAGMTGDLNAFGTENQSVRALRTREELETYIGFVGGEPGRFWTDVCLEHFPGLRMLERQRFIGDGVAFGKGLQMINILRDLPEDLTRGRCYVPEDLLSQVRLAPADLLDDSNTDRFQLLYADLVDQTVERLRAGVRVIEAMPRRAFRSRLAVWWPLAIGLRTLEILKRNEAPLKRKVKISRKAVYGILARSVFLIPANCLVRWSFRRSSERLD
jgi:farnesyl-diphosphate farnesyltransferase